MHSSLKIIFRCLLVGLPQNPERKAITTLKTDAFKKNGRQISQYKSNHIFTIDQYGHHNSPKELNFSPRLETTLCAQFP